MPNIFTNIKRLRVFLLLLADLLIPISIVWGELDDAFESVGAYYLLFLMLVGVVIHIFVSIALTRIWFRFFISRSRGMAEATILAIVLILLWTALLIAAPIYSIEKIAPIYNSYLKNKGINALKQLESFYEEPTYLPPQVKFLDKRIEKKSGGKTGYAAIETSYACPEINKPTFGYVSVRISKGKQYLRTLETVNISGKEAVFEFNYEILTLYEKDVTRSVSRSGECGVTKEDLVKIMESLRPA